MNMKTETSLCLWFDDQALQAAEYYTGIFKNSEIINITRFPDAGREIHGKEPASVMTVDFVINSQRMTALNGGPDFRFNEALSVIVYCDTQEEIDYYWERLCEGGDESARQCGWLKDRYGLSWQIVPREMDAMFRDEKSERAVRTMKAMLGMKKLDIEKLRKAYDSEI